MRGEAGEYGFGRVIRALRQLAATPGCRRFDPAFCRLYALAAPGEGNSPASTAAPVRVFTGSLEELEERLRRLEEEEASPSLLREKIELYRAVFNIQAGIPEERADAFFIDFLRCVGALQEMPDGDPREFQLLDGMCLEYADYRRQRMAEHNSTAEKKARGSAAGDGLTAENASVRGSLRAALSSGARAAAVLSWAQEPVWVSEKLYAGFEQRVEAGFTIDAGSLEEISADGKTASVRVDRRLETARKIAVGLCRSFVRLGALEKARQCEQLLDAMALGYAPRKKYSLVAFEDENWKNILERSPVFSER